MATSLYFSSYTIAVIGALLLVVWNSSQDVHAFAPTVSVSSKTMSRTVDFAASSSLYSSDKNSFSMPDIDVSSITEGLSEIDIDRVVANVKGDNEALGTRGEYYFLVQAALILFIVIGGLPILGPYLQAIGGPGLLLGGVVVGLKSLTDLGSDSLSPFPSPPKGSTLKTDGIYGQMRHPLYTSLLMIMAGLSISTNSADRLLLTAVLWYFLEVKSDKEEEFLMDVYGQEYADYKISVPGKFLPADLMDDMPWNQK